MGVSEDTHRIFSCNGTPVAVDISRAARYPSNSPGGLRREPSFIFALNTNGFVPGNREGILVFATFQGFGLVFRV